MSDTAWTGPWVEWEASITNDLLAHRDLLHKKLMVAANAWSEAEQAHTAVIGVWRRTVAERDAAVARAERAEADADRWVEWADEMVDEFGFPEAACGACWQCQYRGLRAAHDALVAERDG